MREKTKAKASLFRKKVILYLALCFFTLNSVLEGSSNFEILYGVGFKRKLRNAICRTNVPKNYT
jgi:hypothetical protein